METSRPTMHEQLAYAILVLAGMRSACERGGPLAYCLLAERLRIQEAIVETLQSLAADEDVQRGQFPKAGMLSVLEDVVDS